jgi:hypothetical protein
MRANRNGNDAGAAHHEMAEPTLAHDPHSLALGGLDRVGARSDPLSALGCSHVFARHRERRVIALSVGRPQLPLKQPAGSEALAPAPQDVAQIRILGVIAVVNKLAHPLLFTSSSRDSRKSGSEGVTFHSITTQTVGVGTAVRAACRQLNKSAVAAVRGRGERRRCPLQSSGL